MSNSPAPSPLKPPSGAPGWLCAPFIIIALWLLFQVVSSSPVPLGTDLVIDSAPMPENDSRPTVQILKEGENLRVKVHDLVKNRETKQKEKKVVADVTEAQMQAGSLDELLELKKDLQAHQSTDGEATSRIIRRAHSLSRSSDNVAASMNNLWVVVCFVLIFMMQPGFAFLESGLIRFTNVINVLFKNTITTCISGVCFLLIGYSLMFNASDAATAFHGEPSPVWLSSHAWAGGISAHTHFLFQLAFAMTAATIVSGAVAGRITLLAYLIFTVVMTAVIYPISGSWAWSKQGWLATKDFHDFAGSSVVHCVGGFAALAGAWVLGPRLTLVEAVKKGETFPKINLDSPEFQAADILNYNQSSNKPHNVGFATLGTFLLWMGWFGFNGGSELAISGFADDGTRHLDRVGAIVMYTFIAGCAGGVFATAFAVLWHWASRAKYRLQLDIEDVLNGVLGGCVAITAGCDLVQRPMQAIFIGGAAGVAVFAAVLCLYKTRSFRISWLRIDDPVGAIAVHAVCGMLGTMACSFLDESLPWQVQAKGILWIGGWSFVTSLTVFWIIRSCGFLRATSMDEIRGLDRSYHGKSAYKF